MRFSPLFAALALTLPLTVPPAAHADTIDDFTLLVQGHTITFSVPSTATTQDHPHIVSLGETVSATIDGVPNYSEFATFYLPILYPPSMTLTTPSFIDGGFLTLYGPYLLTYQVIPISDPSYGHPDDLLTTFVPGMYTLTEGSPYLPPATYALTITQEATPPATTPEPASIALLATGVLATLGAIRQRRRTSGL